MSKKSFGVASRAELVSFVELHFYIGKAQSFLAIDTWLMPLTKKTQRLITRVSSIPWNSDGYRKEAKHCPSLLWILYENHEPWDESK